jgi:hypothetical protein
VCGMQWRARHSGNSGSIWRKHSPNESQSVSDHDLSACHPAMPHEGDHRQKKKDVNVASIHMKKARRHAQGSGWQAQGRVNHTARTKRGEPEHETYHPYSKQHDGRAPLYTRTILARARLLRAALRRVNRRCTTARISDERKPTYVDWRSGVTCCGGADGSSFKIFQT